MKLPKLTCALLVALVSLAFASIAQAGDGCFYQKAGDFKIAQHSNPLMAAEGTDKQSPLDPNWVAALKQQEKSGDLVQQIVIHN